MVISNYYLSLSGKVKSKFIVPCKFTHLIFM